MYSFLEKELSEHIIKIGASLSPKDLQFLKDMQTDIRKRLDRI
jgi:hypothetical protein